MNKSEKIKPAIDSNSERITLASHVVAGLLASQDPDKGWNLDTLCILSLKIADGLIHYSKEEKLPELFSRKEDEKPA
jgi:hypothetical protein